MQNIMYKFNALIVDFLNQWIHYLEMLWPVTGLVFGLCVSLAWLNRNNKISGFFIRLAMLPVIFQLVF